MRKLNLLFAAFAVVLCCSVVPAKASGMQYAITDMGRLDGLISGINNNGDIVGAINNGYGYSAFIWTTTSGMQIIQGADYANGINDSGTVVGQAGSHPFIWDQTHGLTTLSITGQAVKINNDGYVIGQGFNESFLIKPDGTIFNLYAVEAYGLNESGQIVGVTGQTGTQTGFIWDEQADIQILTGLIQARGINDYGQIAGVFRNASSPYQHACILDIKTNSIIDIGSLGSESFPTSINNSGQVVGFTRSGPSFYWDSQTRLIDVSALLPPDSQFASIRASAINNYGQIAGIGLINGESHAFLLSPVPEPTTVFLFGLGIILARRKLSK